MAEDLITGCRTTDNYTIPGANVKMRTNKEKKMKPAVFNYSRFEKIVEDNLRLQEENKKLKEIIFSQKKEIANLQIRCRIAEEKC